MSDRKQRNAHVKKYSKDKTAKLVDKKKKDESETSVVGDGSGGVGGVLVSGDPELAGSQMKTQKPDVPKAKLRTHRDASNSEKQRKAVREEEEYRGDDAVSYKSSKHIESTWLVKSSEVEGLNKAIKRAQEGGKIVLMGPAVATGRDWKKHWCVSTGLNLDDRWLPYRGSEEIDAKVRSMLESKNLVLAPSLSEKTIKTVKEMGFEVFSLSTPVSHIENATRGEEDTDSRRLARDLNYRDRSNILALTKKSGLLSGMMDGTCQKMGDLFSAVKKMEDQRMPSGDKGKEPISALQRHDEEMDEIEPAGSKESENTLTKPETESAIEAKPAAAKPGDGNSNN